jgi:hypothetical protein
MNVIGLGNAGCNIAELFNNFPQYKVYLIDTEEREGKFKLIRKHSSHEEYEANCPSLKTFFRNISGASIFVVCGSGKISGASLRVIQSLKSRDISIMYIKPDTSLLSELERKRERVVFHILQQYCRSGLLGEMCIIDNKRLEDILQDVPVIGYYDKLNNLIVNTFHMIKVLENNQPEISNFSDIIESARITTIGLVDIDSGEEKLFYDLTFCREMLYYYSIQKEQLEQDSKLMKKIKDKVKKESNDKFQVHKSYGVYSNTYGENYVYCKALASLVQEENVDFLVDN